MQNQVVTLVLVHSIWGTNPGDFEGKIVDISIQYCGDRRITTNQNDTAACQTVRVGIRLKVTVFQFTQRQKRTAHVTCEFSKSCTSLCTSEHNVVTKTLFMRARTDLAQQMGRRHLIWAEICHPGAARGINVLTVQGVRHVPCALSGGYYLGATRNSIADKISSN